MSCVHCNFCGTFPTPEKTSFCLSNCGHIFCNECIEKGKLSVKCNQCNATAPKFVPIDRTLPPTLQVLFKKPSQLVAEYAEELGPIMKFQAGQRLMRLKATQSMLKTEREQRVTLQSQNTTLRDELKMMQRQHNQEVRSRNSSRESARSNNTTRGADVSEMSSLQHTHTMSSSVSSNEATFLDPFKTPANGLKRFATSTPKAAAQAAKQQNSIKTSRHATHNSTAASLSSYAMEVDEDIIDVTPARPPPTQAHLLNTHQMLHGGAGGQAGPTPKGGKNVAMGIYFDPLITSGPRTPLPKTPAPQKGLHSLSMAERLSAPSRQSTTKKSQLKPDVTPPGSKHKMPHPTPLQAAQLKALTPITPIRPINGSQLHSSSVAALAKKPEKSVTFKTPTLPPKKQPVTPRTLPASIKTGFAPSTGISQPHM